MNTPISPEAREFVHYVVTSVSDAENFEITKEEFELKIQLILDKHAKEVREKTIRECAALVETQWNSLWGNVNQYEQAKRSSKAILSLLTTPTKESDK